MSGKLIFFHKIRILALCLVSAAVITYPLEAAERENPLVRTAQYLQGWAQPVEKTRIEKPRIEKDDVLVRTAKYLEDWARPVTPQEKKLIIRAESGHAQPVIASVPQIPDWSIIIYADVKTAAMQQFFSAAIPENAELLIESSVSDPAQRSRLLSRPAAHNEMLLEKTDSSFSERLTRFLVWAKENKQGRYVLLIINIPEPVDIRALARSLRDVPFSADVAFFNIGGLDNVSIISELRGLGKYIIISERSVPESSIPAQRLFSMVREPTISPLEFAKVFPRAYVEEYAHDGSMAVTEGGYRMVGLAAFDTAKLTAAIDSIKNNASEERVSVLAGYPNAAVDDNTFVITLAPDKVRSFEARIEACPYGDREKVMSDERQYWIESNQDLTGGSGFVFDLKDIGQAESLRREFIVKGDVAEALVLRPWLPGAQYIILTTVDGAGRSAIRHYTRDKDYYSTESFPQTSFLVSEAHSQGASFGDGNKMKRQVN